MEILAEASTRTMRTGRERPDDNLRWAELTIYWSDEARHYVVETVRRSDVYHRNPTDCEAYEAHRIETVARDLAENDRPCYRCEPPEQDDLAPYDIVLTEVDRVEVRSATDADAVLTACLEMTGDGASLTRLARRALAMSSESDSDIRRVYKEAKRAERNNRRETVAS